MSKARQSRQRLLKNVMRRFIRQRSDESDTARVMVEAGIY
jgi:hypothetical protein